jgi:hypothetical protein
VNLDDTIAVTQVGWGGGGGGAGGGTPS